jgi:glyoxylase-like metal-dependent hydrolase (beta-lactamase superfamily II)
MRIGEIEIVPVLDAVGALPLDEFYPEVTAEEWEPYRALYPEVFDGPGWRLLCNSYLIRSGGLAVLVDTGLGKYELFDEVELVGGLVPALAEHGVGPNDVDTVFLTHLHVDHIGTNTEFGRAHFAMHPEALAAAPQRGDRAHIAEAVLPLIDAGRVDAVDDGIELAPSVTTLALEGHDEGHTGLRLGAEAILIADAAGHPALLDRPEWSFVGDLDPARSAATRRALLDEVLDTDTLVICGHFPGSGIGRVTRADDERVVWLEARTA